MKRIGDTATTVLLVDDEPSRAKDRLAAIVREGEAQLDYEWAPDLASAVQRLGHPGVDVVAVCLDLPDAHGVEAVERLDMFAAEVPVVVVAEAHQESLAARCVHVGAQDWVVVEEINAAVFPRVVRYAIERHYLVGALRQMSAIDELTNLYSVQGLLELGEQHLTRARRMAHEVLVLHFDIIGFRQINASLGHDVGDELLLGTASLLRRVFRGSDLLARVGGDEFAVLALDAGTPSGPAIIGRLLETVAALSEARSLPCELTVEIGFAGVDQNPGSDVAELLELAKSHATEWERPSTVPDQR